MAQGRSGLIERLFVPRHDYLPGTEIFRKIDFRLIAREMELEGAGKHDGESEIPSTDSTQLTMTEREIVRRVNAYWDATVEYARRAHASYVGRWSSLTRETQIDTLDGTPKRVAAALYQAARDGHDRLVPLYRSYDAERRHLDQFRSDQGIERPSRRPVSLYVKVGGLAVAAIIELGINTSFFADADEFGLAGALLKVLIIPALNIAGVGVLIYLVARNVLRREVALRAVGAAGLVLAVVFVLGFNLAVAHLRDALSVSAPGEASDRALASLSADPLSLISLYSWMLFGAGVFAAVIGALEGWFWEDPYPGYARRAQAFQTAEADFIQTRDEIVHHLHSLADTELDLLRSALLEAETATSRRPELSAAVDDLADDLRRYARYLEEVGDDLMNVYREANRRARSTPVAPRFEARFVFNLEAPNFSRPGRGESEREIAGLLSTAIQDVTKALDSACARVPTLSEWSQGAAIAA